MHSSLCSTSASGYTSRHLLCCRCLRNSRIALRCVGSRDRVLACTPRLDDDHLGAEHRARIVSSLLGSKLNGTRDDIDKWFVTVRVIGKEMAGNDRTIG